MKDRWKALPEKAQSLFLEYQGKQGIIWAEQELIELGYAQLKTLALKYPRLFINQVKLFNRLNPREKQDVIFKAPYEALVRIPRVRELEEAHYPTAEECFERMNASQLCDFHRMHPGWAGKILEESRNMRFFLRLLKEGSKLPEELQLVIAGKI